MPREPLLFESDLKEAASRLSSLFDEIRGASFFITGGTGFIGRWLLESLLFINQEASLGCQFTLLVRDARLAFRRPYFDALRNRYGTAYPVSIHIGDVVSFSFPEQHSQFHIHAAAETKAELYATNAVEMFHTIVQGTHRALECARAHNAARFLFVSSGAVYGTQHTHPGIPLTEDALGTVDPLSHKGAYSQGKRAAETLCTLFARQYGVSPVIARCFAFVGPYLPLDSHFAACSFLAAALRGEMLKVNGDGTPHRSYMYGVDLVVWLITILVKGRTGAAYNVGGKDAVSIAELAALVDRTVGEGRGFSIAQPAHVGRPTDWYVPSIERAERELGLRVAIPLPDALQRTFRWWREAQQVSSPLIA